MATTVVALWIDILLAIVPDDSQLPVFNLLRLKLSERRVESLEVLPGFPKTVPIGLIAKDRDVYKACSPASRLCLEE